MYYGARNLVAGEKMKHTNNIRMRVIFWAMLGVACLASNPQAALAQTCRVYCPDGSSVIQSCSSNSDPCSSSGRSGGYNSPSRDYEAERRAQEAAAVAERQRQAEAERIERERIAEEKRKNDEFIRNRDATSKTLKGSSGDAMSQLKGLAGTDNYGLKGSGIKEGSAQKSTDRKARLKPAPHTETSVVDARNVPSGLPKGLDDAIAGAYSEAPPGVSDRVRKGFQAVMSKDWKVAKAWFQDALNRDPNNAGLKRLVALTDAPQPSLKGATNPNLQLPDPNDIRFLFPGLQAMKNKEKPVFNTLPDGRRVQMPQDSDMEFLFGSRGASSASAPKPTPTFIIGKSGQLIPVLENSDQKSPTYIKGKDGKLLQVPQPQDMLLIFPGNGPATESGKTR